MPTRAINNEVLVADDAVVRVGREDIDLLRGRVRLTLRKRIRLCAHRDGDSPLHEMFIVLDGATYIRPHKHLGKAESLLVIQGEADAVFFEDSGAVREVVRLGDYGSGQRFYYRISDPFYHTLLLRSDPFVFHEATQGPFDRAKRCSPLGRRPKGTRPPRAPSWRNSRAGCATTCAPRREAAGSVLSEPEA